VTLTRTRNLSTGSAQVRARTCCNVLAGTPPCPALSHHLTTDSRPPAPPLPPPLPSPLRTLLKPGAAAAAAENLASMAPARCSSETQACGG